MPQDKERYGSEATHETKRQLCEDVVNLAVLPLKQGACAFLDFPGICSLWAVLKNSIINGIRFHLKIEYNANNNIKMSDFSL
ncbi:hypothetical protein D0469_16215 [Peribacillus saganii]|uniref:Uncharacterized protein n=1 Tax=Peribacillus saganii TaxID=2303992 RepID=A0A372LKC7_9BACI|nr:hypothetical protein D0469_16215 [Peribacillus saganii]